VLSEEARYRRVSGFMQSQKLTKLVIDAIVALIRWSLRGLSSIMKDQQEFIVSFSNITSDPMKDVDLVRMANQITTFFEVYPKSEALDGIAKHIHNSWDPRMRNAMKTIVDAGGEGLKPLCIEAMRDYFKGPRSDGRPVIVNPSKLAPLGGEPSFADGGGDG